MKILQIAGIGKHFGSGHFKRQKMLERILIEKGHDAKVITISTNKEILRIDLKNYDIIIKDTRNSSFKEDGYFGNKPVIAFDDLYKYPLFLGYRFILNAIPSLIKIGNCIKFEYLFLPNQQAFTDIDENTRQPATIIANKEKIEDNYKNGNAKKIILVSFGLLDPYNLSDKTAKLLSDLVENRDTNFNEIMNYEIVFFLPEGKYEKVRQYRDDVKRKRSIYINYENFKVYKAGTSDFFDFVRSASIIITHFGLFFFETLTQEKNIILISPTPYHYKLSEKFFKEIHIGSIDSIKPTDIYKKIEFFNKSKIESIRNLPKPDNWQATSLLLNIISYIEDNKLKIQNIATCPICEKEKSKIISFNDNFDLVYCKKCRTVRKVDLLPGKSNTNIDESYYYDQYRSFYGKTYIEDRQNIRKLNERRLSNISHNLQKINKTTINALDFGGALGFFLDDLKDYAGIYGKKVNGFIIEINRYALEYCEKKGYMGFCSIDDLLERTELEQSFDLISFWFCLEHIENLPKIIQKTKSLLNTGGILAISFPSTNGPMFRLKKNRKNYINSRPLDHYFDFNPFSLRKFLEKAGFGFIKFDIPSIHLDRFIEGSNSTIKLLYKLNLLNENNYRQFCKKHTSGDICEIYMYKR